MSFFNNIFEYIFLPINDIVTGQSVYRHLHFLNSSQYWTREQINNYQITKLRQLILHAVSTVPYYRELFSGLGLHPEDIQKPEDLHKIPILTKATIQKKGIDIFTSTGISRSDRIQSSSSGSTGEPLFYYNTKDAYSMNLASSLRGWYWMGYRLGDNYIKLSQNPRNMPIKRIQDKMSRNLYLATNPLNDSNFEFILKEIERYKPKIIRCYPDPLLFLARYKQNRSEFSYKPQAITTTGNTLYSATRAEIEAAFGCKIFDSYSCEGNSTVFECPTHTCYHSAEEYGISEILDDAGNSITSGVGRLVSTDLWNLAHPFIRYDTQDYVETDETLCTCGRKHLRIKNILGRDNEVLTIETGRRFIVHSFTGFFQVDTPQIKRSIDQFQVIKTKDGTICFRLVVNYNYDKAVGDYILNYWMNELKTKVVIEITEKIPLTAGGKRRFIINEL
jgi:phenylacetate-CoA ligase